MNFLSDLSYVAFDPVTGIIRQWTARPNDVKGLEVAEVLGELPPSDALLNYKVDLASVDVGTCSLVEIPKEDRPSLFDPPLDQLKAMLSAGIDLEAEKQRLRYITAGSGKAAVYDAKKAEVMRWRDAGMPDKLDPADYPWATSRLAGLVDVGGKVVLGDVLREWDERASTWQIIGIAIESVAERAKAAIDVAEDREKARAAADVTWPESPMPDLP